MNNDKPISVVILSTLPDHGMKSLGSKSLIRVKGKYLIQYQLEGIKRAFKNREHDITIMCGFDCHKTHKILGDIFSNYSISFVKQNHDNINFCGSFIDAMKYIKYDNVLSINYGAIYKHQTISSILQDTHTNRIAIATNHSYNSNINIGCYQDRDNIINIFFNLGQHKYLDINFWHEDTVRYIRRFCSIEDYRHKFMFELINDLIARSYVFKAANICPKEYLFLDSLYMLNKSKRIFFNHAINNKKTGY